MKEKKTALEYYHIDTNPKTITIGTSGNYYVRFDVNKNGATHSFWDIQIEQGSTATDYEAYVEKKIKTKNSNGEFETIYDENDLLKTQVYERSFGNVGDTSETGIDVDFATMFPNLSLDNIVCFNVEIVDVFTTWDRVYANILNPKAIGTLQIRSYAATQNITVRVTAFYK